MKRVVTKTVNFCDSCQREDYVTACLNCGVEHCWKCQEKLGIEYRHSVHASGSGDGYYCSPCDSTLKVANDMPMHKAYLLIADLRAESEHFYADWKQRAEKAETELKRLLKG